MPELYINLVIVLVKEKIEIQVRLQFVLKF